MKIFYAIQATGNGHISRAMELLPHLEKYGQTDLFLSGSNSTLNLDAPVSYRSKGLSLQYTCSGSLNYPSTIAMMGFRRILKEAKSLPIQKYDLIINDFEAITSLACQKKSLPSIHFGHQASFISDHTPRPEKKNGIGEWILKNYAKGTCNMGLHFNKYDDFIEPPVIKSEIWNADAANRQHVTVYLPSFCDQELMNVFSKIKDVPFEIFSRQAVVQSARGNIVLKPVNRIDFNKSLISCHGIITGAGFETPAEAIYLNKKLLAIPIKGQYEQLCNAEALKQMGVRTSAKIDHGFYEIFDQWMADPAPRYGVKFKPTAEIVEVLMQHASSIL